MLAVLPRAGLPSVTAWQKIRRVWVLAGIVFTVVFVGWNLVAYRASAEARQALESTGRVTVRDAGPHIVFAPTEPSRSGLVFYAGALVDPVAYAPLMRDIATAGFPAVLVRVPRRGVLGGAEGSEVLARGTGAMRDFPAVRRWVLAGHSRGGVIAANFARTHPSAVAALILIGTSHPRDFSLADRPLAVTRIYGTRDTVADVDKVLAARRNLPPGTRDVVLDGGNHSQFGYYGFQPGDWPATISRHEQQRRTVAAVLEVLRSTPVF